MDSLIQAFRDVFTFAALVVALGGGFLIGVVTSFFVSRKNVLAYSFYLYHVTVMLTLVSAAFWVGQLVSLYLEGDPVWIRGIARFALQLVFSVSLGTGVYVALRLRLRWRMRREQR